MDVVENCADEMDMWIATDWYGFSYLTMYRSFSFLTRSNCREKMGAPLYECNGDEYVERVGTLLVYKQARRKQEIFLRDGFTSGPHQH